MEYAGEEKRRFSRVPYIVKAEVMANDVVYTIDEISNLSVGGCLLPIEAELRSGTKCYVRILLSGTNAELSIPVKGEIVRNVPGGTAIKFTQIEPDSLFHLQNIVRFNSPDPEAIEQEILNHPGLV